MRMYSSMQIGYKNDKPAIDVFAYIMRPFISVIKLTYNILDNQKQLVFPLDYYDIYFKLKVLWEIDMKRP